MHAKLRGWSANKSHMTGHPTTGEGISNTVDGWSKQNFSFLLFFLFNILLQSYKIVILQQDNYILRYSLTIAKVTLSLDKKHIAKGRIIN